MPLFSIVTPVFNPPIWALKECINSVLIQETSDWEWCIADDCSTNPEVVKILQTLAKKDSRVKLQIRSQNGGIVEASNTALEMVSGDYVVLLDHDDSLTPNALTEVATVVLQDADVEYIYSNEDKVDASGRYFDEFKKPSFSPERLRGQNYCCHLSVLKQSLLKEIGHFRAGFEGSQDYDLILRATEKAKKIFHIPQVLYHWRVVEGSTAADSDAKPYAFESARRAVVEHCARVGVDAEVSSTSFGYLHVKRNLPEEPKVSIIIPTRGDRKRVWGIETCLVANAVKTTLGKSTYSNYEIIIVHDVVPEIDPDLQTLTADNRVKIVWYDKPFDFSEKCNLGVIESDGEIIVLLNDDTEIYSANWLEILVGFLSDPSVAMVGPMTVLEDGRIQSAGHGNNPTPHNLGAGELIDSLGPFGDRIVSREVSGVTGACLAITRNCYFELGGLSLDFPHSFNDVDLAYKALEMNYRIIWTPLAKIWHFESLSRDPAVRTEEVQMLTTRWGRYFNRDRYTS